MQVRAAGFTITETTQTLQKIINANLRPKYYCLGLVLALVKALVVSAMVK